MDMAVVKWDEQGRVCTRCKEYKGWENYSKKSSVRYGDSSQLHQIRQPCCQTCSTEDTKNWRINQSKERLKDLYYRRFYGMGLDEFNTRHQNQAGKCKICDRLMALEGLTGDRVVVDHCHTTGKVRGLLCNECNRGLGFFKDNPMTLSSAMRYLTEQDQSSEGGQ